jgi:hypothetical protein
VDVKKKGGGGVITHKNVFIPRHVLFLGLMYSFFLGGDKICVVFFYWFIENAHLHVLLILTV